MKIKNEFSIPAAQVDKEYILRSYKANAEFDLGTKFGEAFGWQEIEKPPHLHSEDTIFKLEIMAFSMGDWLDCMKRIFEALPQHDSVSRTRILNALNDLESK
jgi:hypothetical protein